MDTEPQAQVRELDEAGARAWLAPAALLALATLVAYAPSLGGGFLWDDPEYVVNNIALRSGRGLMAIWTSVYSVPQWYPLVHTSYWLEYQLFGLNPAVFRVDNLLLHIASALLLWRLLRRLKIPGAYLAALIFALHPVHVESVAWITERKNTLSSFLYLAAFLTYWNWRSAPADGQATGDGGYALALLLFLGALMSKTVTASFPAAMLVMIWWQSGRVRWSDVLPLLPFFALGIGMGLVTAELEKGHVGATGAEWTYAATTHGELAARTLIAGRALWFYAGKIVFPYPLSFMYERWTVDPSDWRQWLYPLSAAALLALTVHFRSYLGRGPAAALLLFGGTLFPALGYFNVYPHRYSFVADHFQYLASIPLITLLAAALTQLACRLQNSCASQRSLAILIVVIGSALGLLTYFQARVYQNALVLWQDAADKSPRNWVVWTNLGKVHHQLGRHALAGLCAKRALELAPHVGDTWFEVANTDAVEGHWDQAVAGFTRARELAAQNRKASGIYVEATAALGRIAFLHRGDAHAAEQYYQDALSARPRHVPVLLLLAYLYEETGRGSASQEKYLEVLHLDPTSFDGRYHLGNLYLRQGKNREAAEQLSVAVVSRPASAEAWARLGWARLKLDERAAAMTSFQRALALNPNLEEAKTGLEAVSRSSANR